LYNESSFKKLLFLTDGSPPSLSAQELTIQLAKKLGAEVTVFHVVTHELMKPIMQDFLLQDRGIPESADSSRAGAIISEEISLGRNTPTAHGAHYGETTEGEITSIYRQQGEDVVADSVRTFKEEGIHAESKVVENKNIVEAVMEEVNREDYDLIVMGRSGRKEKESRLGAVAEKMSRHSEIPVLVAGEKNTYAKLLVPVDGSKNSQRALAYAASLAKKAGGSITLLHVQESRLFNSHPEVTKTIGNSILTEASEKLKGIDFDKKLESGDPARRILDIAEKGDFDLIVMGGCGHNTVARFLLGSVSNHVLHYTEHAVLVVK
jgi:nucleotide-binding universal stress UspA family protein